MKYIRWLLAWSLFWIGDVLSGLDRVDSEWLVSFWFPVYSCCMVWSGRCMIWSSDIQGDSDFGPWGSR